MKKRKEKDSKKEESRVMRERKKVRRLLCLMPALCRIFMGFLLLISTVNLNDVSVNNGSDRFSFFSRLPFAKRMRALLLKAFDETVTHRHLKPHVNSLF